MPPDAEDERLVVDIEAWIKRAEQDPATLLERQATDVFLSALSITRPYATQLVLKGGVLMGVVYDSPRQTGDIDFTAIMEPTQGIAEQLADDLKQNFVRAAANLGYVDLLCAVQSHKYFPKGEKFPKFEGPAITLRIGYAQRGSPQERLFKAGKATNTLDVDISFKEPVSQTHVIELTKDGHAIRAYTMTEVIAEKYRALLQQPIRNRNRRQDVYDIHMLITKFTLSEAEKGAVFSAFISKCQARRITPDRDSLSEPEVARRAKSEWQSLALEIGVLPDFDMCFVQVLAFYQSLPWHSVSKT